MANIIPRREEHITGPASLWRDPLEAMRDLFRIDPFLEMGALATGGAAFVPAFEVKETKDGYMFKADVPGVAESDLEVTMTGNRLTISGKREAEKQEQTDTYYTSERSYGSFTRSFTLPDGVDPNSVNASVNQGVLTLSVRKTPEAQPKRIQIQGSQAAPKRS